MSSYWQPPLQSYRVVDWNKWVPTGWQVPVVFERCLQENVLERKNRAGNYPLPAWHHTWCCEHRLFWQDKPAQHWEWLLDIGPPGTELPDFEHLGTGLPGTELPGTGLPGTELPGTELPGTELPGTEQLGTEQLDFEQLGTGWLDFEQLGTGPPDTGLPDTGLPGTECGDSQGCYHIVD